MTKRLKRFIITLCIALSALMFALPIMAGATTPTVAQSSSSTVVKSAQTVIIPIAVKNGNNKQGIKPAADAGTITFYGDGTDTKIYWQVQCTWAVWFQGRFSITDLNTGLSGGAWNIESLSGSENVNMYSGHRYMLQASGTAYDLIGEPLGTCSGSGVFTAP